MNWLGLDIGGANLKAANAAGWGKSVPFALWRDPAGLAGALQKLVSEAPQSDGFAVTMTGELCDCYSSKDDGVQQILRAVEEVAAGQEVRIYLVDGRFVTAEEARTAPSLAAASNWRALAEFASRHFDGGSGLVVDIGSTTTDVIPIERGRVAARGRMDTERLAARELVYRGVGRTPICAVVQALPWRGELCPIAAEVFATTADAYVVLGEIGEDLQATWTADGRPLSVGFARQRLARQLCADASDFADGEFIILARIVHSALVRELRESIEHVVRAGIGGQGNVLVSGAGEFLAEEAVRATLPEWGIDSLTGRMGPKTSQCGPAFAVAVLAAEA